MGREAGGMAHGAIHVLNTPAAYAHGVVVVVSHPGFIQRGRVRGFEPAKHPQFGEVSEDHVDGLRRQVREFVPRRSRMASVGECG
ncbi:hypothetical protein AHiyo6_11270, partial [Arthrobacter sp. Hiyo6]